MRPSDAAAVKVLAHPMRTRLLAELRTGGPATATGLAGSLGTNSGATSYHLRRLASVGLVADTGSGSGRERVWAAHEQPPPSVVTGQDEDTRAALSWIERDYVRHVADKAEQWLRVAPGWPASWTSRLGLQDAAVLVTAEQLGELRNELAAVLARYRRVGQGNPQARRVACYTYAYPVDFASGPPRGQPDR